MTFNLTKDIPLRIANNSRNYFVRNFDRQQWEGVRWANVQRRMESTNAYKYPKKRGLSRRTNPILVGTAKARSGGALRRAVSNSIRSYNWREIRLGITANVPYAVYHNEGGKHLAKRQFIGDATELHASNREIIRTSVGDDLRKALSKAFK